MNDPRRRSGRAAILTLALTLFGPLGAHAEQTIRVAYLRTFAMMPFFYADEMGFFKKEGLKVEGIPLNNGPAAAAAVVSGSADVAESAVVPVLLARAHDQPLRMFFSLNFEQYPKPTFTFIAATRASGIRTLAGLKGKTVVSNATTSACTLMLYDHLATVGLSPDAVKIIIIPFPQIPAALELGEADAACLVDPFFTTVMASPKIKGVELADGILANLKELGRAVLDGYYARPDWLAKNHPAAAGFMRAVERSVKALTADPSLYRKQLVERFKVTPELANAMPIGLNPVDPVAEPKDYQAVIDGLQRNHLLTKPLAAADVVVQIQP